MRITLILQPFLASLLPGLQASLLTHYATFFKSGIGCGGRSEIQSHKVFPALEPCSFKDVMIMGEIPSKITKLQNSIWFFFFSFFVCTLSCSLVVIVAHIIYLHIDEIPPKETWVAKSSSILKNNERWSPQNAIDGLVKDRHRVLITSMSQYEWFQVDFLAVVKVSCTKSSVYCWHYHFKKVKVMAGYVCKSAP